jgi:hypothetical protein
MFRALVISASKRSFVPCFSSNSHKTSPRYFSSDRGSNSPDSSNNKNSSASLDGDSILAENLIYSYRSSYGPRPGDDYSFSEEELIIPSNHKEASATKLTQQKTLLIREKKIDSHGRSFGSGGRKSSLAKAWIKPGTGKTSTNTDQLSQFNITQQLM